MFGGVFAAALGLWQCRPARTEQGPPNRGCWVDYSWTRASSALARSLASPGRICCAASVEGSACSYNSRQLWVKFSMVASQWSYEAYLSTLFPKQFQYLCQNSEWPKLRPSVQRGADWSSLIAQAGFLWQDCSQSRKILEPQSPESDHRAELCLKEMQRRSRRQLYVEY